MRLTTILWNSKAFRTALALLFIASLILGVISGELTLIRIESATL
jgi:hypothetical protein